ncbi:hypothetical protein QQY79_03825 [Flavobacterium tructae]|uniref:hypothetical protein n=1 Tax=Flavobacterium tructae TaxID=1114873 RepID=UPI002551FCE8|nr:hypothetical protein [Flavobacterium tructae]MDL2141638.1 hypothetical protein [Flavobacterium tructae]
MNYATQPYIGNFQYARTAKATTTAPTTGRVYELDAKAKGCKPGAERQTQSSANSNASNGILKCTFLPKLKETKTLHACRESCKIQKDFYKSLYRLTEHYKLELRQTSHLNYPYNIVLALSDVEEKLKQNVLNWNDIRLIQDSTKIYLVTEERYNTGSTLFYIPMASLYRMLREPKRKKNAHLLLSVCSYLYHVAGIPYYRDKESYLYWMYEMLNDWVLEDDYTEETEIYQSEIEQAQYIGGCIEKKMYNRANLNFFEQRVNGFKAKDKFDSECLAIAQEAFDLYKSYPNEKIYRNARPNREASVEDWDNIIGMEKYVSFYADHKGWLNETLIDAVNNEMQEYGEMEEPIIEKQFDGRDMTGTNLCFENRLFELLHKLCDILNDF